MNKIAATQLYAINAYITNNMEPLSDRMLNRLNSVSAAPFRQDDSFYYIYKTLAAKAAKLGCKISDKNPFDTANE